MTQQWQHFLRNLPPTLDPARLAELDAAFHFTASGNAEILADWFQKAIAASYQPAYPALERFLVAVGRRKFLMPLYGALARTPAGRTLALRIYAQARPGYHPVTQALARRAPPADSGGEERGVARRLFLRFSPLRGILSLPE